MDLIPTTAPYHPKRRGVILAFNDRGNRVGETHHNAKISDETVDLIRELREDHKISYEDIAHELKVPLSYIRKICSYQRRAQAPSSFKRVAIDPDKYPETFDEERTAEEIVRTVRSYRIPYRRCFTNFNSPVFKSQQRTFEFMA